MDYETLIQTPYPHSLPHQLTKVENVEEKAEVVVAVVVEIMWILGLHITYFGVVVIVVVVVIISRW